MVTRNKKYAHIAVHQELRDEMEEEKRETETWTMYMRKVFEFSKEVGEERREEIIGEVFGQRESEVPDLFDEGRVAEAYLNK